MKKIVYIVALLLTLTACNSFWTPEVVEETIEEGQGEVQEAVPMIARTQEGGILNLSMRSPKTLNPLLNQDRSVDMILQLLFEPLVKLDENLKPMPYLAESIEFSVEGLSALVTMKEDLRWNDGTPLTVEDVAYSIEVLQMAPDEVIYKDSVRNLSETQILDGKTIRLHFNQAFGGEAYLMRFPIIPKHYYEQNDVDRSMQPLGSGLYQFESYTREKQLVLNRASHQASINKIHVLVTPNEITDLNAFEQFILDVVVSEISDWGKHTASHNTRITDYATTNYDFIGFNLTHDMFQDVELRQMIASLIPVEAIVSDIYVGHALKTTTPVHPSSWLYEEQPDLPTFEIEEIIQKVFSLKNQDLDGSAEDIEEEEQQYVRILVNEENDERAKVAHILKEALEQVGFQAEIYSLPFEEFQEHLKERDFDLFVGGFSLSLVPDFRFAFHSSEIGGGLNYFGLNDPEMDARLEEVSLSIGEESYKRAVTEFQNYFFSVQPCISIAFRNQAILTNERVKGELQPTYWNRYDNIAEWFIHEATYSEIR